MGIMLFEGLDVRKRLTTVRTGHNRVVNQVNAVTYLAEPLTTTRAGAVIGKALHFQLVVTLAAQNQRATRLVQKITAGFIHTDGTIVRGLDRLHVLNFEFFEK